MFPASSCPSLAATTTAVAASGLPSELGDSSAVGRGRAGCLNVLYMLLVALLQVSACLSYISMFASFARECVNSALVLVLSFVFVPGFDKLQHCYHQAPTVNQRLLLQLF